MVTGHLTDVWLSSFDAGKHSWPAAHMEPTTYANSHKSVMSDTLPMKRDGYDSTWVGALV